MTDNTLSNIVFFTFLPFTVDYNAHNRYTNREHCQLSQIEWRNNYGPETGR